MVIAIFGESCTGKSSLASRMKESMSAVVYTGSDYLKMAKTEYDALLDFKRLLSDKQASEDVVVYVISERDQLMLLPENCVRIRCTAPLDVICERFAARMNGHLPQPVAQMLERKHGAFDNVPCDLCIDTSAEDSSDICERIRTLSPRTFSI